MIIWHMVGGIALQTFVMDFISDLFDFLGIFSVSVDWLTVMSLWVLMCEDKWSLYNDSVPRTLLYLVCVSTN